MEINLKENFIEQNVSQITVYHMSKKKFELINNKHPRLIETMSVTKSFLALAVLFLIQDKKIPGINTYISDYITEWKNNKRKTITIKDVLSMTSQLENNWDYDSFMFPEKDYRKVGKIKKPNVDRIARNMKYSNHKSPKDFEYNNLATQIIPSLVLRILNIQIDEFLKKVLFEPLNISIDWNSDDDKNPYGPNGLRISSNDLCKVGVLILNKGIYEGKKILDTYLVDLFIQNSVENIESIRKANEVYNFRNLICVEGYGLLNWIFSSNKTRKIVIFMGYMGQMLIIDFDNKVVASKLNWCDYNSETLEERQTYLEFIEHYLDY